MASRVEEKPPELPIKQHRSRSSCSSVESDCVTFSFTCNDVFPEPTDCHAAQCPIHQRYDPSRHQMRFFSDDAPPPVPKKRLARTLSLPGPTVDPQPPLSPLQGRSLNFDNPLYMLASVPDPHLQEETEESTPLISISQLSFDTPDHLLHLLFSRFEDHTVVSRGIQHRHLLFLQSSALSAGARVLLQGEDVDSYQLQDFLLCDRSEPKVIGDRVYYGLHSPRLPGRMLALRVHKRTEEVCSPGTKLQPSHVNVQQVITDCAPGGGGGGGGRVGAHTNPNLTSVQSLLQDGLLLSVERDLPKATLEDFIQDSKSGDGGHVGYDRQVCTLLLQILTGSQHLYNISTAAAELRPRGIFLVWDSESGVEPDPEGAPSRGQRPGKLEGNTQMLWRKLGSPRVVLTPLTPAQSGPHPLTYISSQTRALIHFLLSEDGTPSKSRSWYRRGLLYLAWRLQSEATRPQIADMVALLQVLLWGPRVDHRRPADAVHNWLTVKRALLVMKLAERGLIQDQSPLDWEDCMCLQYLAFTDPSAVLKVSSQLWINVNMVNAS